MAEHTYTRGSGGLTCTTCGLWVRGHAPAWLWSCPGMPYYRFEEIPAHLATKTTLEREGLRAPDAGAGYYVAWTRKAVVPLYDRAMATPKRQMSDAQRAGLSRAQEALKASRTCQGCGRQVQSKGKLIDAGDAGRLCRWCYELWEHEQDRGALYVTAAAWLAEDASGERPLRVLDTETTGLGEDAEIVELAIVDAAGATVLHSLVRPSVPIEPAAAAVHGLTDADLADAPRLADLWPRVRDAIRGARVVAYNADFDRRMLAQSAARYDLKRPGCRWDCLMELCTALSDDGERWLSLEAVCWELGVAGGGHRALGDALAAAEVLRMLAACRAVRTAATTTAGR